MLKSSFNSFTFLGNIFRVKLLINSSYHFRLSTYLSMYYVTCKVCTRWSFQYESCVFFSYKNSGSSSSKCNNVCTRDCMRTCLFQFSFDLINHLKTSEGIFIRPAIFFTSNRHTIVQQNRRIATLSLKISLCYTKKTLMLRLRLRPKTYF